MLGLPFVQGTTIEDVFDPTVIWDEALLGHQVFKLIRIKLSRGPLLGDVDLLAAKELELALRRTSINAPCSATWFG